MSHNHSQMGYLPPIFFLNYLIQRLFVTIVRRCLLRGHFLLGGVALWRGECGDESAGQVASMLSRSGGMCM